VGGTLAGRAWQDAGWGGVVLLAGGSTVAALLLAVVLGRTRSLERR
jgi:YNFM family putative membrane transporter